MILSKISWKNIPKTFYIMMTVLERVTKNGNRSKGWNYYHQRLWYLESNGETKSKKYGRDGHGNAFCWGTKSYPTKLHAIMKFPDLEALQAFGANEELTEERRQADAIIESGIMTMMADDKFLTNFPAPFTVG
jgi:hypothetical protein